MLNSYRASFNKTTYFKGFFGFFVCSQLPSDFYAWCFSLPILPLLHSVKVCVSHFVLTGTGENFPLKNHV